MTTNDRIETFLDGWLADGPTELPPHVLRGALAEIATVDQASTAVRLARPHISDTGRILLAAAAVVVIVVGASLYGRFVALPSGPAAPGPVATPAPTLAPAGVPFESRESGYLVRYPEAWQVRDALGPVVTFAGPADLTVQVAVVRPGGSTGVDRISWPWGSSFPIVGTTADELADKAVERLLANGLSVTRDDVVTLGGEPARRILVDSVSIGELATPVRVILARHGEAVYVVYVFGSVADQTTQVDAFLASFSFIEGEETP